MEKALNIKYFLINLNHFDNTQTTGSSDLSTEMKTYYSDYLVDIAEKKLVHSQFAQKHPIPKNGGKTIEFRRYTRLNKATTPLTEGVTPTGNSLKVTKIEATIEQYGDYIELSDILDLTAIDNNLVWATKLLGIQSGETLDTLTREVLHSGTVVQYGDGLSKLSRSELDETDKLSVKAVRMAVRTLKNNLAEKVDGQSYVAIVHPDSVYDLTGDQDWVNASQYAGSTQIFEGEIGKIHGVRFIETTEAKKFVAADLSEAARELTYASNAGSDITISETLTANDQTALVGRKILLSGYVYTVTSATASTITVGETIQGTPSGTIFPGEGGKDGIDVYSTIFLGADAYGETEVSGGGLETIVKQLGSAGTADPLNQRSTSGWKATHTSEILVDEYMVRVEHCTTFNDHKAN